MRSRHAWRALGLTAAAAACVGATTGAFAGGSAPAVIKTETPRTQTVNIASTAKRDCTSRPLAGRKGVWTRNWTAARQGSINFQLLGGSSTSDWDLALFDARDKTLVSSSEAFRANEVAGATVKRGARLIVQACRRSGSARSFQLRSTFTPLDVAALIRTARQGASLVKVPLASRSQYELLVRLGFDVTEEEGPGWVNVILHGSDQRNLLQQAGFQPKTLIADLHAHDRKARAADRAHTRQAGSGGSGLPSGRTEYRVLSDYQTELKAIAEKHKDIVRPITLKTKTFQGRDLQALEIAKNVGARDDGGRPTFFLNAMHHAREWPAAESAIEFAHEITKNPRNDPRIDQLLEKARIVVMPLTNADGFNLSRGAVAPEPGSAPDSVYSTATGVVILGGSFGYKRKNCNPVAVAVVAQSSAIPCEVAIGVDPNRNYGESWGGPGASTNPNDQSYRGSGPFSEPEPQAVREIFSSINATSMLTIHNIAALVLRPPGLKADGFAPDEEALKALGKQMADATGYTNQYGWQLYDTTGTTDDWTYAMSGGFGYTIELGPAGGGFHDDYKTNVIDEWVGVGKRKGKGIREAYLLAAEAAFNPAYTSRLKGRAPAGRTLRIVKEFVTLSYPVCAQADLVPVNVSPPTGGGDPLACIAPGEVIEQPEKIELTTQATKDNTFEWYVNPSTRPFPFKAGKKETYKLTCELNGKVVDSKEIFVIRGETLDVGDMPCGGVLPAAQAPAVPTEPLKVSIGKPASSSARKLTRAKSFTVRLGIRNGVLNRVKLELRRGSKVVGVARKTALTRSGRVRVKLARGTRLKKGTYRLVLSGRQLAGESFRVSRTLRLRK